MRFYLSLFLFLILICLCALFSAKWPPAVYEAISRSWLSRAALCGSIVIVSVVLYEAAIGVPSRDLVVDVAVRRALSQKQSGTNTNSP